MGKLTFISKGKGAPLLLIHGFPMNQTVWNNFTPLLTQNNTVITVDLPGFGQSDLLPGKFEMDDVAAAVLQGLDDNGIENPVVIGHSLGGYVTLAMAAQQPDRFPGIGLFHSTALPDNAEKRASRDKAIAFVETHGAKAFTEGFIPPLFADPQHVAIPLVRALSGSSLAAAVIGYTRAMRDRKDHTRFLEEFSKPVLFLAGEKDGAIPAATIIEQAERCKAPDLHILPSVAHMGMFEATAVTSSIITAFMGKCVR